MENDGHNTYDELSSCIVSILFCISFLIIGWYVVFAILSPIFVMSIYDLFKFINKYFKHRLQIRFKEEINKLGDRNIAMIKNSI